MIANHLAGDPLLAPLVAARPGLRVPGAWDGFEKAVCAVLGQQITVAGARLIAGRLVAGHGTPDRTGWPPIPGLTHRFPAAADLAGADLSALGVPRARAAAVRAVAEAARADPGFFQPRPDPADAIARLRRLPGIGDWTAQYIALRSLRVADAFPAGDIVLRRALADDAGRLPSETAMLRRAEAWRPWRAYAAQHLWTARAATPRADRPVA